jgi:hypothetical protein
VASKEARKDRKQRVVEDVLRLRFEIEDLHTQYTQITSVEQHALANELRAGMDQKVGAESL